MDCFNDLSVISWNIGGALGRSKKRHVRDLVSRHHPSLFLVYETHDLFSKVENFWSSLDYKLVFVQEAHGHAGGIWVLSCRHDVSFDLVDSMPQAITFLVTKNNKVWYCSAIYASPTYTVRCTLWDHLKNLRGGLNGPWLLLGDLNEVLKPSEVSGGIFCFKSYSTCKRDG